MGQIAKKGPRWPGKGAEEKKGFVYREIYDG